MSRKCISDIKNSLKGTKKIISKLEESDSCINDLYAENEEREEFLEIHNRFGSNEDYEIKDRLDNIKSELLPLMQVLENLDRSIQILEGLEEQHF